MTLTDDMLRQIMPNCPKAKRAQCLPHLVSAMAEFHITNYLRASAFLATIAVESGELRFFEEIASGAAYEGRLDLGNTQPGDGKKYKGRGVIQVTGRDNSEKCLKFLKLPAGHPELLAELSNAFRSGGWFWDVHKNLNPLADQRQFLTTQIRVNGKNKKTGLPNGWNERRNYYERALRVLPEDLKVTAAPAPAAATSAAPVGATTAAATVATSGAAATVAVTADTADNSAAIAADGSDAAHADTSDSDVHEARPLQQAADEAAASVASAAIAGDGQSPTSISDAGLPGVATDVAPAAVAPDAPVVHVEAAAPAKERSKKSLVSTLAAGLGSVVLTVGSAVSLGGAWLKNNPEAAVLIGVAVVAVIVCYMFYQHRQTKLDLADREHAKEVTLETMRIRADPRLVNVQVVPRAVPPDSGKG